MYMYISSKFFDDEPQAKDSLKGLKAEFVGEAQPDQSCKKKYLMGKFNLFLLYPKTLQDTGLLEDVTVIS